MFELHTERLRLIPLELLDLQLLVFNRQKLEHKLGLQTTTEVIEENLKNILEKVVIPCMQIEPDYRWRTDWQIVLKSENRIIGSFGFKGTPGETGHVEIGYGIQKQYQNQGYTTEAVQSAINWAFSEPNCNTVIAKTLKYNYASMRVLEKCHMDNYDDDERYYYWKIEHP